MHPELVIYFFRRWNLCYRTRRDTLTKISAKVSLFGFQASLIFDGNYIHIVFCAHWKNPVNKSIIMNLLRLGNARPWTLSRGCLCLRVKATDSVNTDLVLMNLNCKYIDWMWWNEFKIHVKYYMYQLIKLKINYLLETKNNMNESLKYNINEKVLMEIDWKMKMMTSMIVFLSQSPIISKFNSSKNDSWSLISNKWFLL